jgi:hypothetical protein
MSRFRDVGRSELGLRKVEALFQIGAVISGELRKYSRVGFMLERFQ